MEELLLIPLSWALLWCFVIFLFIVASVFSAWPVLRVFQWSIILSKKKEGICLSLGECKLWFQYIVLFLLSLWAHMFSTQPLFWKDKSHLSQGLVSCVETKGNGALLEFTALQTKQSLGVFFQDPLHKCSCQTYKNSIVRGPYIWHWIKLVSLIQRLRDRILPKDHK